MTYESKRCTLKTRDGKYITVQKYRDAFKLCVIEKQGSNRPRQVELFEDSVKKHVALFFWHNSVCFSLTVDASSLKLKKSPQRAKSDITPLPTSCLFVKKPGGTSGWYTLESVQEPNRYLSIESIKQGQLTLLILRSSNAALLLQDV